MEPDPALLEKIRMKPMRTLSGVTTVTVLTKPYPCPGKCIFCPTDVRMPKSYLPDEPGAMRALEHEFDPFTQVESRIRALKNLGTSHRQDRTADFRRHMVFVSARLSGMVHWSLFRCDERTRRTPLSGTRATGINGFVTAS
jgi:hypothetical protein